MSIASIRQRFAPQESPAVLPGILSMLWERMNVIFVTVIISATFPACVPAESAVLGAAIFRHVMSAAVAPAQISTTAATVVPLLPHILAAVLLGYAMHL